MLTRCAIVILMFAAVAWSASGDPVLLASRRAGLIEAVSLDTLETTSRVRLDRSVESVASDPSGKQLFVALPSSPESKGCCALFALDLPSLRLTRLVGPALRATATLDRVLTQRGNVGIEVFDTHNLVRLPTIKAPGGYRMQASPDGRWLFGATNFPSPSLDLFDLSQGKMVWQRPFEKDQSLQGAWIGEQYYLFSADPAGQGRLWSVRPDNPDPGDPLVLSLPGDAFPGCGPIFQTILAVGDRLVIYEQFGDKLDRRRDCPRVAGGFVLLDPKTGVATDRLAASNHFRQMVGSADGRYLYGLDVGNVQWKQLRLVKLDATSGATITAKSLDDDVWFLTSGTIPPEMEGNLDLTAVVH